MKQEFQYHDLRTWIDQARKLDEVRDIEGASWQEDIGMATELLHHSDPAPVAIFDSIPGYPKGHRVLTNFFGGRRRNMTLGFPTGLSNVELSNEFIDAFQAAKPLPYEFVEDAPILENVKMGDDVNVLEFPTPFWHEEDGGRYIGTGTYDITLDPDEGWINLGTYRVMVQDEKTVGYYISPGKHGRVHRDKYLSRGEPMPTAIVVGGDPLLYLMACSEVPYGISEYELAGGLRGKPYPVVKGKITGLPIPANAEIVLEGFVHPTRQMPEGPFGEWTGYYASGAREEPVMEIKAIYHRNNPIILGCPPNRPPDEIARYRAIIRSGLLKQQLQAAGIPGIKAVWADEVGSSRMLVSVAIEQRFPGHATQVGHQWEHQQSIQVEVLFEGVTIWNSATLEISTTIQQEINYDRPTIVWSPDKRIKASFAGRMLLLQEGTLTEVQLKTPFNMAEMKTPVMAWSPDGTMVGVGGSPNPDEDGIVQIWDVQTATLLYQWIDSDPIAALAWSPSGKYIAISASQGGHISIRDIATGNILFRLQGHRAEAHGLAWSPDGQMIVAGAYNGQIFLWKIPANP